MISMSKVEGEPLGSRLLSVPQLDALVGALQQLFAVPVDPSWPERILGPSTMRPTLREWASNSYDLSACREPVLVHEALGRARAWLAIEDRIHDGVTDAVPAHGDGNLANILWDGTTCRLIDFEEFGTSDIAYEVADLVEHASSRLRRLLDVEALLARLQLDEHQSARLTVYRRLLATFWLVVLLPGNRGFDRNPVGSTEDQAHHLLTLLD